MKKQNLLKVRKLNNHAKLPTRAYSGDLGYDLYAAERHVINPSEQKAVWTGISVEFPERWGGVIKDRSSMAAKMIYTSAGVIDNGYRGEIKVLLRNESDKPFVIEIGDKIAQLIPIPVIDWEITETDIQDSDRNTNGFGSSGK
ncbi:MAG: dUTP diphosphatase [Nitrospinae bacterium]|nr:dUTP diphosphatase [Nitrospinota bacterium]